MQKFDHLQELGDGLAARDPTTFDSDDDGDGAKPCPADRHGFGTVFVLDSGPISREAGNRIRAVPEKPESLPLHEFQKLVVGQALGPIGADTCGLRGADRGDIVHANLSGSLSCARFHKLNRRVRGCQWPTSVPRGSCGGP